MQQIIQCIMYKSVILREGTQQTQNQQLEDKKPEQTPTTLTQ